MFVKTKAPVEVIWELTSRQKMCAATVAKGMQDVEVDYPIVIEVQRKWSLASA
jgi:hypothetical protein